MGSDVEDGPEYEAAFSAADRDADGEVSFYEFQVVASSLIRWEDMENVARIRLAFNRYDFNRDGTVETSFVSKIFEVRRRLFRFLHQCTHIHSHTHTFSLSL